MQSERAERSMSKIVLTAEDCLEMYGRLEPNSLDLIATDPPGAVSFMGREWDGDRGGRSDWIAWLSNRMLAARRVAKPGAYSVTWALPRTSHWTGIALEDAGWQIVDVLHHCFGQGWNKNGALLRPGHEHWFLARKPVEKGLTIEQNVEKWGTGKLNVDACRVRRNWADRGEAWMRSGHSAKPDAKKISGAPAGNGMSLNPEGSVPTSQIFSHCPECEQSGTNLVAGSSKANRPKDCDGGLGNALSGSRDGTLNRQQSPGYASDDGTECVPAFHCLVGCDCGAGFLAPSGGDPPACEACGSESTWWACPVAELDQQAGDRRSAYPGNQAAAEAYAGKTVAQSRIYGGNAGLRAGASYSDTGGASRYFKCFSYHAKASSSERHAGCGHLLWAEDRSNPFGFRRVTKAEWDALPKDKRTQGNAHVTVKGLELCRWLLTLIAPPGRPCRGADGFTGSGGFAIAASQLGIDWHGCDIAPEAILIAESRLSYWRKRATASAKDIAAGQFGLFALMDGSAA